MLNSVNADERLIEYKLCRTRNVSATQLPVDIKITPAGLIFRQTTFLVVSGIQITKVTDYIGRNLESKTPHVSIIGKIYFVLFVSCQVISTDVLDTKRAAANCSKITKF